MGDTVRVARVVGETLILEKVPSRGLIVSYNFDQRLLHQTFVLDHDNYDVDMLRVNGIYYQLQSDVPVSIGDVVYVADIVGNQLIVQKGDTGDDSI